MNNPDNMPIDVDEMRDWLNARKEAAGVSWTQLALESGIKAGTLSPFASKCYAGNNENIARQVYRYRQRVESQAERSEGLLEAPGYFDTPTSRRLNHLMVYAHMGRITVGATGPGTGKTMAAREYAASVSNAWIATMWRTDRSLNAMIIKVLRAIGVDTRGSGWTRQLSHQVVDKVAGKRGLLIIDEANHLDVDALEEIRSWHDETGVGICLLGNEELLMRIEGGQKRDQFARLNSRIGQRHIQTLPETDDVTAFCDAWQLGDPLIRQILGKIALSPGAGGLRECHQIVENASMLAHGEGRTITAQDIRDALSTRATRNIRT